MRISMLLGFVLACGSSTPAASTTNTSTAPSASAAPMSSASSSSAAPGISLCGGLTTEYVDALNAGGTCATAADCTYSSGSTIKDHDCPAITDTKTAKKLDEIKTQMSGYHCDPPPGTLGACSQARKKLECKAGHCG